MTFLIFSCSASRSTEKIEWVSSFEEARIVAERNDKNILIDFYTDWCSWCKVLDESTYTDRRVVNFSEKLVWVKVNAEKVVNLASRYKVNSYPTLILTKSDGAEIDRILGYLPPKEFLNRIKAYSEGKYTLEYYKNKVERDSTNIDWLYRLAQKYFERGDRKNAVLNFERVSLQDSKNEEGKSDSALYYLALISMQEEQLKKAVEYFQKLVSYFNDSPLKKEAQIYIPYLYGKLGDKARALTLYNKFLEEHPESNQKEWIQKQISELRE